MRWPGRQPLPLLTDWTQGALVPGTATVLQAAVASRDPLGSRRTQRGPVLQDTGQSWPPGPFQPTEAQADVPAPWGTWARHAPAAPAWAPRHLSALSLHAWRAAELPSPGVGGRRAIYLAVRPLPIPGLPAPVSTSGKAALYAPPASHLPIPIPGSQGWVWPSASPGGLRRQVSRTPLLPLPGRLGREQQRGWMPAGPLACSLRSVGGGPARWRGPCPLTALLLVYIGVYKAEWGPRQAAGPPRSAAQCWAGAIGTGLDCPSPQRPHCEVKLPSPLRSFIY